MYKSKGEYNYEEMLAQINNAMAIGVLNESDFEAVPSFRSYINGAINSVFGDSAWMLKVETAADAAAFMKNYRDKTIAGDKISAGGDETEAPAEGMQSQGQTILAPATEAYMELDNNVLQQGLVSALKNDTDQIFPLAQAIVEKNWGLISPNLNINNQQEMEAAKEVVIDQLVGTFEGSGQGKYSARNTSALEGFSLDPEGGIPGAQVSTYLTQTIKTRKPEIDAAIAERTAGPGIDITQVGDVAVETTETIDEAKVVKKPSETTGLDKKTEDTITEAITDSYKGKEVTLAETRNIPKKVAAVYGDMFGVNPQTITDKKRNFQKKDAEGLTKAKQFLLKNATADFARLPKTVDAEGKGTFIPKNVRDVLYTDGKLTGNLKDYLDLIRTKPTKPIYRDRTAQTIRGLLGLHIRNRILETTTSKPKRIQSGAVFSRGKKFQITGEDGIKVVKRTTSKWAKDNNVVIEFEGETIDVNNLNPKNPVHRKFIQNAIETDLWKYFPLEALQAATLVDYTRDQKLGFYFTKQEWARIQKKAKANKAKYLKEGGEINYDTKAVNVAKAKPSPPKTESYYTSDKLKRKIKDNKKGVKEILQGGANAIKADNKLYLPIFAVFSTQSQSTSHLVRNMAVDRGASEDYIKSGKKIPTVKEHVDPSNEMVPLMMESMLYDEVDVLMPVIDKVYYQLGITQTQDNKTLDTSGQYGEPYNYKETQVAEFNDSLKEYFKTEDISKIKSPLIRYFNPKVNQNRNGGLPGFNSNKLIVDGKTVAETYTMQLPIGDQNADNIFYQNQLTFLVLNGDMTQAEAKTRIKKALTTNNAKAVAAELQSQYNVLVTPEMRAETQKDQNMKSLGTKINALKTDKPKKGISVFDFDDTLAFSDSKVLVKMPDGKINKITPAEFALSAEQLQADGAEFDFSEFNKVVNGRKGPLADLALKRQEKFGSGDIFVLTARPQLSAPAIKMFLDGIGLNISLENITGLENGTPQAKADWILNKTAEGYNDFYFADDSIQNVEAVDQILKTVDVKSKIQQAMLSKGKQLDKEFNIQLEEVTGKEAYKDYSDVRGRLEGKRKDKGVIKRVGKQLTITPSAEDFMGLMYDLMGKGEQGNKHAKFIDDKLMKPYNKAEQELLSAKTTVANDFAALKKKFPTLRSTVKGNPLMKEIGVGPYTTSQAVRVYNWAKQGLEIPGISKRDVNALVKAVEANPELNIFADELALINKGKNYPAPDNNWLAGDIKSDVLKSIDTKLRSELMTEFNENVDIIFSEKNKNKLRALYGNKWVEALEDSIRRMKAGSNRPVYVGGGARIVNEMLDWLNASVGAVMFLNVKSGLLQLISNVNFINWGDNNMYAAAKAFASKAYWPTVMKLLNSDYLVNRRDGLKINVNEAELADAGRKGGIKGAINYLLDKGFVITRIMDSLAIATGGATFFINRQASLLKRVNPDTGKLYTEAEAEVKAFDDFYAISEESQQSSNPAKISQQQASMAGRVILAFQNVTMQYNRMTKKSIRDLYNRRKKPGMTQRESDLSNISKIVYYTTVQNLVFNAMQQALFALAFDDEAEEEEKNKTASILNGMSDSLLFGLGFGGALISTVKNVLLKVLDENEKKSPDYEEAVWEIFNVSPVLDSKVRKLRTTAKTFSWNMKDIKKRGWSLDNPSYLAISQLVSAATNIPIDRVMRKMMNMRQAMDEETKTWQRVALVLGYSGWSVGLPYWGLESTIKKEAEQEEKLKTQYKIDAKRLKNQGYKRIPLTGPKSGKPKGKLGVDYIQVERPTGMIEYWLMPKK